MILFLVVIYNEYCYNATTIATLARGIDESLKRGIALDNTNYKIVIFDNSDKPTYFNANKQYCSEMKVNYISFKENIGLSKAYNYVIDRENFDWLCLLDQDSELSSDYVFESVMSIRNNPEIKLHLPKVISNNLQISPAILSKVKVSLVDNPDFRIPTNKITAINSGMIINSEVFDSIGNYDERIFLDLIDHNFIKKYRKHYDSYKQINSYLYQNFSEFTNSKESSFRRLQIYKKDLKVYCEDLQFGKCFYYTFLIYRILKLAYKFKSLKFINVLRS